MGRNFEGEFKYKCLTCEECDPTWINSRGIGCNRTGDCGDPGDSCSSWRNAYRSNSNLEECYSRLIKRGFTPGYEHGRWYIVSLYTRLIPDSNNQMYLEDNKMLLEYMRQSEEYCYFAAYYDEFGPSIVKAMDSCLKEHDTYKKTKDNLYRFKLYCLEPIHKLILEKNYEDAAKLYISNISDLASTYNVTQPAKEKNFTRKLKK